MEKSGSARPSLRATRGRSRSSSANVSPRHSTTIGSPGESGRSGMGRRGTITPVSMSSPPLRYSASPVRASVPMTVTPPSASGSTRDQVSHWKSLCRGRTPSVGSGPADPGVRPDVAERSSDDAVKGQHHGAEEVAGIDPAVGGGGPDVVQKVA